MIRRFPFTLRVVTVSACVLLVGAVLLWRHRPAETAATAAVRLDQTATDAAAAGDWPMEGFDARRSSSTPAELPKDLVLRWSMRLPTVDPAWPDQPRMQGDRIYSPIILANRLILASPQDDSVTAYDLASGAQQWRIYTGGPVRCPPAAWKDRVFVGSDDGYLYCLRVSDGSTIWKIKGVPKQRLAVGNGRLIDTWPVRGGPVVADGQDGKPVVYFAAGIWPFMGIFLHCVDAESGSVVWTNSGDGPAYQIQPHNSPAFAGISPQGPLAVSGDRLMIPNGRAVPACYDRFTGKFRYFQLATRAGGDHVVMADDVLFNDGIGFDLKDGKPKAALEHVTSVPAIDGTTAYAATPGAICSFDLSNPVAKSGKIILGPQKQFAKTAAAGIPSVEVLIRAGSRLYAGGKGRILAVDLPLGVSDDKPAWEIELDGTIGEIAAGGKSLVAVTEEGSVYCFGSASPAAPSTWPTTRPTLKDPELEEASPFLKQQAKQILTDSRQNAGWMVGLGAPSWPLAREVLRQSQLDCVIVEPSLESAERLRKQISAEGILGSRAAVMVGELTALPMPPYFASIVIGLPPASARNDDSSWVSAIYRILHPYQGRAYLQTNDLPGRRVSKWAITADPKHTAVSTFNGMTRLSRVNGVEGGGNWTHEHADESNTRVSGDTVVKAPLGMLWWGGSTHDGILPRHGHGPQPQVRDGRILVEGVDMMRCMDIYSGRVLWDVSLPGVGSFYNNTAHQAGANGVGSNFTFGPDGIYIAMAHSCIVLDPATGRKIRTYKVPADAASGREAVWSYINAAGDYLIVGVAPPPPEIKFSTTRPDGKDLDERVEEPAKPSAVTNPRTVGSHKLFVVERKTGKILWTTSAKNEFRHNAICIGDGKLFTIDRPQGKDKIITFLFGPGLPTSRPSTPDGPTAKLTAFDLATGKVEWSTESNVFGTWLSYSKQHDVLMEAGRLARDTLKDEPKGMRAYKGATGEVLWSDPKATGPAMIRGDIVLKEQSAANIITGKPYTRDDPLTGQEIEWTWTRMYGCNTPAASQNLLTFRSGAAGYYDLARLGGTGNFGGFRSSCTNNLIVAGGVLCAPDYTRTCTCSYQIQTSLALVPDTDVEMWTFLGNTSASKERIRRVGINFGAPGNRLADDGTLWLEHPNSGGPDPTVKVDVIGDKVEYVRRHSMLSTGPLPWVTSSGVRAAKQIRIDLNGDPELPVNYTVRLYFTQSPTKSPTPVAVSVQGNLVDPTLDVAAAAGGFDRPIVREYTGVRVTEDLSIQLKQKNASDGPMLCGVEIVEESATTKR